MELLRLTAKNSTATPEEKTFSWVRICTIVCGVSLALNLLLFYQVYLVAMPRQTKTQSMVKANSKLMKRLNDKIDKQQRIDINDALKEIEESTSRLKKD